VRRGRRMGGQGIDGKKNGERTGRGLGRKMVGKKMEKGRGKTKFAEKWVAKR